MRQSSGYMRTIVELVERRKAVGHVCSDCVVCWGVLSVTAVCTNLNRVGIAVVVVYTLVVVKVVSDNASVLLRLPQMST
jgi:hypothetical protein